MSNIKIYNLNQNGGAPVKKSPAKKLTSKKSSPKKITASKIKGFDAPSSTSAPTTTTSTVIVDPMKIMSEEQLLQIKTLSEELIIEQAKVTKCENDNINVVNEFEIQKNNIIEQKRDINETQTNLLKSQYNEQLNNLTKSEENYFNTKLTEVKEKLENKINELKAEYNKKLENELNSNITSLRNASVTELNNIKQQKINELNAQLQVKINEASSQINKVIIDDALVEYKKNISLNEHIGNKGVKKLLTDLCPINSTNKDCEQVIKIPEIYQNPEYIGCYKSHYPNHRFPSDKVFMIGTNSAEICTAACIKRNKEKGENNIYAATFYSNMCACGSASEVNLNPKSAESDCYYGCANNIKELCGSYDAFSIYKIPK